MRGTKVEAKMISRLSLVSMLALLLTFGSGLVLGLFLGSDFSATDATGTGVAGTPSKLSSGSGAPSEGPADSELNARIHDLENELAEEKSNEDAQVLQDRFAFFKQPHEGIYLQTFDDKLKISPAMADVLGLTKEEVQAVEKHLQQTKGDVDSYESANLTLVKQSADSVTYEIPANPEGKEIQAQLDSMISVEIVTDRAGLITADIDKSPYSALSAFDENKRQIEIKWDNQHQTYAILDSVLGPDGRVLSTSVKTTNSLPPRYEHLLQADTGQ